MVHQAFIREHSERFAWPVSYSYFSEYEFNNLPYDPEYGREVYHFSVLMQSAKKKLT